MGARKSKASPSRGGGTAQAVTERSYQICGNLSVTFGDSFSERGAFGAHSVGAGSAPPVVPTKSLPAGGAEPRPYKVQSK